MKLNIAGYIVFIFIGLFILSIMKKYIKLFEGDNVFLLSKKEAVKKVNRGDVIARRSRGNLNHFFIN